MPGRGDPPATAREGPMMGSSIGSRCLRAAALGSRHLEPPHQPRPPSWGHLTPPSATWGGPSGAEPALPPADRECWNPREWYSVSGVPCVASDPMSRELL